MKQKNIREYLSSKYPGHTWILVHERSMRSVYRLERDGVPEYFVKIYDPSTLLETIRNFTRPRTLHEADMLARLRKCGVPVPGVHDHIRLGAASALVTRAIFPATPLHEAEPARQAAIMLDLAVALLNRGFFFTDMHAGNVVLDREGRACLLDAYEISPVRRITGHHVTALFAQILNSHDITDEGLGHALGMLEGDYGTPAFAGEIRIKALGLRRRYVKKRVRRSMRDGSFSREIRGDAYTAYVRRNGPLDLDEVLTRHHVNIANRTDILKYQEKTQLSTVGDYCVKTYKRPRPLCAPYAVRSWKGLLTLYFNHVCVAEPGAVAVFRDRSSVLVTGMLREPDLDEVLSTDYADLPVRDRRKMAAALGRMIGYLHSFNVYHSDLKACNIKVGRAPLRFYLLDTDRVEQARTIARSRRLRNLVQINTSIPVRVSRCCRMAFLKAYTAYTGEDPKSLFREVWRLSAKREIVYRTPSGDTLETWKCPLR